MDTDYECLICNNLRWLSPSADLGANDFGRLVPCECQEAAWGVSTKRRLKKYSQLPDSLLVSFANDTLPDGLADVVEPHSFRAAFEAAREFADNLNGWLVLSGTVGVGKTHLARAVVEQCIELGVTTRFEQCMTLLDKLRDMATDAPEDSTHYFEQIIGADLLVLDDLEPRYSDWGMRQLTKFIEQRYKDRLPTMFTTNYDLNKHAGEPLFGRFYDDDLVRRVQIVSLNVGSNLRLGVSDKLLKVHTFENFSSTYKKELTARARKYLAHAKEAAQEFAKKPQKWLYIGGPTATGKTHLSVAILNEMKQRNRDVVYRYVPDMLEEWRHSYRNEHSEDFHSIFKKLKNVDCLILDDLGSEQLTAWSAEKLYQLVVYRYDNSLPTVITSRGMLKKEDKLHYKRTLEDIYQDQITARDSGRQYFDHYLDAILGRLYDETRVYRVAIEHDEAATFSSDR